MKRHSTSKYVDLVGAVHNNIISTSLNERGLTVSAHVTLFCLRNKQKVPQLPKGTPQVVAYLSSDRPIN
eukprot:4389573-Amphidinium_carterae.1